MNIRHIAFAIRLFSIWLITWALRNLPAYWVFDLPSITERQRLYTIGFSALILMIGVVLLAFPFTVAQLLMPGRDEADYPAIPQAHFQHIATALLGLWVLSDAVPNGGYAIIALSMRSAPLDGSVYASLAQIVIRVAMGIWLLSGAKRFWQCINKHYE